MSSDGKKKKSSKKQRSKNVTLKTLAQHVKLSPATISVVLNGSPVAKSIPAETQERVFRAAKELGYRPNLLARSLRNQRSLSVGVIVPEVIGGYAIGVIHGIEEPLIDAGYFYLIASHLSQKHLLEKYMRMLLDRSVEGFLLVATQIDESPPVPTVAVAGHRELDGVTNVVIDHDAAIYSAMKHLVDLGHREIAFFKGHPGSADTEIRWRSIHRSAESLGIEIHPELSPQLSGDLSAQVFTPQQGYAEGYAFGRQLLAVGRPFSALVAFNDVSAIGAMRAFLDAGMSVPEDISVIGFDDIESAAFHNPGLTTIRQPLAEMGELASRTLLERLGGNEDFPRTLHVSPELVVRGTTGPPPSVIRMKPPAEDSTILSNLPISHTSL